jgi:hypothetical protein
MSDVKTGSAFLGAILAAMVLPCAGIAPTQRPPLRRRARRGQAAGRRAGHQERAVSESQPRRRRDRAQVRAAGVGRLEAVVSGSRISRAESGVKAAADLQEPQTRLPRKVLRPRVSFLQHSRGWLPRVRQQVLPAERDLVAFRLHVPRLARIPHPAHAPGRRAVFVPAATDPWAASRLHLAHITGLARRATPVRATDPAQVLPARMQRLDQARRRWAACINRVPDANPSRRVCSLQ